MTPPKLPFVRQVLSIGSARQYAGGYHDEDVEAFAFEDGQAAIHNPSRCGENTYPYAIDVVNTGHEVNAGLIGHAYRDDLHATTAALDAQLPTAKSAEHAGFAALEAWRRSQIGLIRLRHEIESRGLSVPSVRSLWWLIGGIGLLFAGETSLISVGYQVFGLSDRPLIPFVSATDELHLAAYASVTALLVLAHVAGHKLRLVAHDVERRRSASSDETHGRLPQVSKLDVAVIAVCVIVAWLILDGLSAIRVDYLREQGINARTVPFVAIQIGIFAAALFLSYTHAHPFGRQWADRSRETTKAEKAWQRSEVSFTASVGTVNAAVDLLDTLLAQAGHHVGVSEADARRQAALYARRVVLSQPEQTVERLLPPQLPQPTTRVGAELAQFLAGVALAPRFDKLTTDALTARCDEIRTELRDLDETLGAIRFSDDVAKELGALDSDRR